MKNKKAPPIKLYLLTYLKGSTPLPHWWKCCRHYATLFYNRSKVKDMKHHKAQIKYVPNAN